MSIEKQYWSKVLKTDGCWSWVGAKHRHGYGQIRVNKKLLAAHRVSWLLHYGQIPDGMCVLHKCDNPECTNPEHLFIGTMKDNSRDMMAKGRGRGQFVKGVEGKKTYICHRGHQKEFGKDCIICKRAAGARYHKRQIEKRPPRICPICEAEFKAFGKRKYCSQKCKWTASNRVRRARRFS